jgi:hypothetical protein
MGALWGEIGLNVVSETCRHPYRGKTDPGDDLSMDGSMDDARWRKC